MMKTISVRIEAEEAQGIERLARWRGESMSTTVARLIRRETRSQQHVLEALDSITTADEEDKS